MRDPERIKLILELIENIWEQKPDLRLCQILHGASTYISFDSDDLFYLEDEDLIEGLVRYKEMETGV
jgi:uncharacterized protein YihD (DUF1040 family)